MLIIDQVIGRAFKYLFIYLCAWVSDAARAIFIVLCGIFHRGTWTLQLQHVGSGIVVHGLRCSLTGGIFVPDQGSNLCPLYCKVDS